MINADVNWINMEGTVHPGIIKRQQEQTKHMLAICTSQVTLIDDNSEAMSGFFTDYVETPNLDPREEVGDAVANVTDILTDVAAESHAEERMVDASVNASRSAVLKAKITKGKVTGQSEYEEIDAPDWTKVFWIKKT